MTLEIPPVEAPTYIQILSQNYPEIGVSATGAGDVYEELVSDGPLPTKEQLDIEILYATRISAWRAIQHVRDYRKAAGVKIGSNWFHSDDTSRIQQIALVMFGANMPANIMWKTMQGTFVQMTPTLAGQIFQAIAGSDQLIYGKAEFHRQSMILSADPAVYDFTTGWTMMYEESPEHANLVAGGYQ